jgi:malate dehydrogenase
MAEVAILGAGPIGAAVAQALASRGRVRAITLIDAAVSAAAGKALDVMQSGPVDGFDTRVSGEADVLAAATAPVIVVADQIEHGQWRGEAGLGLVKTLMRAGARGALVFAGPEQIELMELASREAGVSPDRMIGTAASAMVSALQALVGLELDLARVEVTAVGRPPGLVVAWSAATAGGALISERVPPHRLLAISNALRQCWPPGPYAIGAATTRVVEALLAGSRSLHPAMTVTDGVAVMLPLSLGHARILARIPPTLSQQERGSYLFSTDFHR